LIDVGLWKVSFRTTKGTLPSIEKAGSGTDLRHASSSVKTCYPSSGKGKAMNTVIKRTKVEPDGWLKVQAPPELENQEVDVIIVPQRPPAAERVAAWQRLCEESKNLPSSKEITDEDIQKEIDDYRAGR
jgi:hypothetical protein